MYLSAPFEKMPHSVAHIGGGDGDGGGGGIAGGGDGASTTFIPNVTSPTSLTAKPSRSSATLPAAAVTLSAVTPSLPSGTTTSESTVNSSSVRRRRRPPPQSFTIETWPMSTPSWAASLAAATATS